MKNIPPFVKDLATKKLVERREKLCKNCRLPVPLTAVCTLPHRRRARAAAAVERQIKAQLAGTGAGPVLYGEQKILYEAAFALAIKIQLLPGADSATLAQVTEFCRAAATGTACKNEMCVHLVAFRRSADLGLDLAQMAKNYADERLVLTNVTAQDLCSLPIAAASAAAGAAETAAAKRKPAAAKRKPAAAKRKPAAKKKPAAAARRTRPPPEDRDSSGGDDDGGEGSDHGDGGDAGAGGGATATRTSARAAGRGRMHYGDQASSEEEGAEEQLCSCGYSTEAPGPLDVNDRTLLNCSSEGVRGTCPIASGWFHAACVGGAPDDYANPEANWFCPNCRAGVDHTQRKA